MQQTWVCCASRITYSISRLRLLFVRIDLLTVTSRIQLEWNESFQHSRSDIISTLIMLEILYAPSSRQRLEVIFEGLMQIFQSPNTLFLLLFLTSCQSLPILWRRKAQRRSRQPKKPYSQPTLPGGLFFALIYPYLSRRLVLFFEQKTKQNHGN